MFIAVVLGLLFSCETTQQAAVKQNTAEEPEVVFIDPFANQPWGDNQEQLENYHIEERADLSEPYLKRDDMLIFDFVSNKDFGLGKDNELNVCQRVGYIFIDGKYTMIQNIVYFWSCQEALNLLHLLSQAYETIYGEPEVFDTESGPIHLWAEQKIVLSLETDLFAFKIVKFDPGMSEDDYMTYSVFNRIESY